MSSVGETLVPADLRERSRTGLLADLVTRARERLKKLLLVAIGLTALALAVAIGNLALEIGTAGGARAGVLLSGILLALEIGMFAVIRSERVRSRSAISIALVWQVAVCATISVLNAWIVWDEQQVIPRVTWTSLLIVVVPLILPAGRRQTAVALLASALTVPAGLVGLELTGHIELTRADLIGSVVSPALALALAILVNRITDAFARDLAAARQLGAYDLREEIGRGGMGRVLRATHRLLARPTAIKIIRADKISAKNHGRFVTEARAIARLRSPHTVEIYDFGTTEDQRLYFAMELLDGLTLQTLVDRFGAQPPERVAHLLAQICHSLGEAHEAGLIHRDVKPGNIFLCRHGRDRDVIKVLDWGLVGVAAGATVGTPPYIPPEVNAREAIDGRSDLWALGKVALWLVCGDEDAALDQVEHAGLRSIIARCLEPDPADRWQSADQIVAALGDLGSGWRRQDAAEWWRVNQPELSEQAVGADTVTASGD